MENPFVDIGSNSYYYKAALWAYQNNMVLGNRFEPNKPCTRSMAVMYMWQFAGFPEVSAEMNFNDVSDKADYLQAVDWAVKAGVTNGISSTQFAPNNTCTRAQIVTFLYRARDILVSRDGTEHTESLLQSI